MIFDIYGRFRLDVRRENDSWVIYRPAPGKRVRVNDVVIPATLEAEEIAIYLDDIYHELAGLGERVKPVHDPSAAFPDGELARNATT